MGQSNSSLNNDSDIIAQSSDYYSEALNIYFDLDQNFELNNTHFVAFTYSPQSDTTNYMIGRLSRAAYFRANFTNIVSVSNNRRDQEIVWDPKRRKTYWGQMSNEINETRALQELGDPTVDTRIKRSFDPTCAVKLRVMTNSHLERDTQWIVRPYSIGDIVYDGKEVPNEQKLARPIIDSLEKDFKNSETRGYNWKNILERASCALGEISCYKRRNELRVLYDTDYEAFLKQFIIMRNTDPKTRLNRSRTSRADFLFHCPVCHNNYTLPLMVWVEEKRDHIVNSEFWSDSFRCSSPSLYEKAELSTPCPFFITKYYLERLNIKVFTIQEPENI